MTETADGRRQLRFDQLSACERCLAGKGCGAGVFSRLFARRQASLPLGPDQPWSPGQRVRVGISSKVLIRMALRLYGWPLLGFLVGVSSAHWLLLDQVWRDPFALLVGITVAVAAGLSARPGRLSEVNPRIEPLSCN